MRIDTRKVAARRTLVFGPLFSRVAPIKTVAPSNATRIVAAATGDLRSNRDVIFGQTASGRSYTRTVVSSVDVDTK